MKPLLLMLLLWFVWPACAQTPVAAPSRRFTWQGAYVDFQRFTDTHKPFVNGQYSVNFLAIVGVGKKTSVQFQVFVPVLRGYESPAYAVRISRRVF